MGYDVRYVRNITDAGHLTDDGDVNNYRFVKQSRLEKLEPMEIVQKYTVDFHKVLEKFNLLPPTIEPDRNWSHYRTNRTDQRFNRERFGL